MPVLRKLPDFYKAESSFSLFSASAFAFFLSVLIFIPIFFGKRATFLEWVGIIFWLFLESILISTIAYSIKAGLSAMREKENWMNSSILAQATIAKIEEIYNPSARYYGEPDYRWKLELEMLACQSAACPGESMVEIYVDQSQFRKFTDKNTLQIRYSPADPLVFLLENEF
jgi:hypothetical protein